MKKLLLSLAILLPLAAACGDDDSEPVATDDGTAVDDTAADDTATDPGDGVGNPIGGGGPIADLVITYEHPDEGVTLTYQIGCLGDTFPITGDEVDVDPIAACAALADDAVLTRLVDGPAADLVCTEQYGGPDVATITGTIDGQAVDTTVDRTNGCGIGDWDDLLADLLPPALGVTS